MPLTPVRIRRSLRASHHEVELTEGSSDFEGTAGVLGPLPHFIERSSAGLLRSIRSYLNRHSGQLAVPSVLLIVIGSPRDQRSGRSPAHHASTITGCVKGRGGAGPIDRRNR